MKGLARRIFWNWTCSSTTSCSALRGYNVLVSSSVGMGWICCSLHFHGGDFNGREGWAGKLLQVCWKSSAKGWALSSFFDGTCLNTTSSSALREHDVLVSSSVDMGYRSVSACVSMVATMDGKAGRENCCTLAEKALPKVGQTKYWLFQRNMFTHNLLQRSAWVWHFRFFIHGYGMGLFQPPCPWWQQSWMGGLGGKTDVLACALLGDCWWLGTRTFLSTLRWQAWISALTRQRGPYWNTPGNTKHRPQWCLLDCSEPLQAYQGTWWDCCKN